MKKTTWIIIGLSVCLLVLATTLGIIHLQKRTETIFVSESEDDSSSKISSELKQIIESFYIRPLHFTNNDFSYLANAVMKSGQLKMGGPLYFNNQMYGVPIVSGITIRHYGKATVYSVGKAYPKK